MSGYFVHGGTQFPFSQSATPHAATGNSYYGSTSYPTTQALGQSTQFSSYASAGSALGSSSALSSSPYAATSSTASLFGSSGASGYTSASYNSAGASAGYSALGATHTSYEKALYNAANLYYSNKTLRGGPAGGRGSTSGRGRGRGGRGNFSQPQNTGPKPIKATEIKAYIYAWCGQRKLKPEYEITTEGKLPQKVTFTCKLSISGLDHVAEVQATNKKDAQTKAAWEYCDHLVKSGYMKASELPPKPAEPSPKPEPEVKPVGSLPGVATEPVLEKDGWNLTNARQRLNQFCQREQTTPIFKHSTVGSEGPRVFLCELTVNVGTNKKEYNTSQRGVTKKQATAMCALDMIHQLLAENLIEKFGDAVKHVSVGGLLFPGKGGKGDDLKEDFSASAHTPVVLGQKRKADDEGSPDGVDENGNWTVDNSRQRLTQFCEVNKIPCEVLYEEEGVPGNRTFTAALHLKVRTKKKPPQMKEINAVAKGQSKRVAAQGCALQLLSQLYKLSLVEAGPNQHQSKKRQLRRLDCAPGLTIPNYTDFSFMPFGSGSLNVGGFTGFGRQPMLRKTPHQDTYLAEKHKAIFPSDHELDVVHHTIRTVEQALKDVSDALMEPESSYMKSTGTIVEDVIEHRRKLQGVMRVGALAKGLLLKDDLRMQIVLLCQEIPTAQLLVKVAQLLPKHIKAEDGYKFTVGTAMQDAAINVTSKVLKTETSPSISCNVTISLTSVLLSNAEEAAKDTPGSLNKEKCLQALAELRHSKWYQACASNVSMCDVIIRILRDMTRRLKEWKALSDWTIELLVEKALSTAIVPLSLGSAFLRCIEIIAAGIFLRDGPGISDPCEKAPTDAAAGMTNQEREALTASAQDYARMIVYRKIYEVLEMEPIDFSKDSEKEKAEPMET